MKALTLLIALLPGSFFATGFMEHESPKLAIITLKLSKKDTRISIEITNRQFIESGKRIDDYSKTGAVKGDIICYIADSSNNFIDTMVIPNPFRNDLEYPDTDGGFGRTSVEIQESLLLLRFRYSESMKYFRIAEVKEGGSQELIKVLKILE